jgi:hypothetical protein
MIMEKTKTCRKCKEIKSFDCFYNAKRIECGKKARCKSCDNEAHRLRAKLNPEKYRRYTYYWKKRNPEKVKSYHEKTKIWKLENRNHVLDYTKKWHIQRKKMSHTLKEISTIFINQLWPYSTEGKDDVSRQMREIMGDISPVQRNSFLSMPNLGRELNLLQDVIRFEDSIGIERDAKLFRSIQRAFAKFFPSMKVEKDCVDNYSINTNKVFDVAHLDYNGFLTDSHIQAAKKLVNDGTMTFVTLNMHPRFEKIDIFRPLEDLTKIGNVVFEKEYYGKRKCPMITLGITA